MKGSQDKAIPWVASLLCGIRSYCSPTAAKRVLVIVALAILPTAFYTLVFPSTAETAPCTVATVQVYIGLGSTGCTIGDKIFSNFVYEPSWSGIGIPIPAGGVLVTPLPTLDNPGMTFTAPDTGGWKVTGTSTDTGTTQSLIWFDVRTTSGKPLIKDARVDAVFSGTGEFADDVSEFGCFDASSKTFCAGASGSFFLNMYNHSGVTLNPSGDSTNFTPVALLGVSFVSIQATASHLGAENSAVVTSATYHYSEVPTEGPTVPEPATAALLGTGLLGLVSPRLLRHSR